MMPGLSTPAPLPGSLSHGDAADATAGPAVIDTAAPRLLAWYDRQRRHLPWRVGPGEVADPYRVWLSEIMLQQTTVAAVKPYFAAFLERWPSVTALADSPLEAVLGAWAGLGYYSRARNLHACAVMVAREHGGCFPDREDELRRLPGIGAYTAAAIAAIAFGRRAVVVDGNVERVVTRLLRIETPLPTARAAIRQATDRLTPATRAGDFAQAMMDLGATICRPRKPACSLCPLAETCAARVAGDAERYPVKARKAETPLRHGVSYVARRADGAILVRRRAPTGLLGGMLEPPGSLWVDRDLASTSAFAPPIVAAWQEAGTITHTFTHFRLEVRVLALRWPEGAAAPRDTLWLAAQDQASAALPTVMRKIIARGRAALDD
jgi:A/G-specific adenine glycosylase